MVQTKACLDGVRTQVTWRSWPGKCSINTTTESFIDQNRFKQNAWGKIEMRKQKGFSLIELLIVVAIILIIAAIAIPNLLRARMAANESSAVASVRTVNTAKLPTTRLSDRRAMLRHSGELWAAPWARLAFPASTTACLIDSVLANNGNPAGSGKSGYMFTTGAGNGRGWRQHWLHDSGGPAHGQPDRDSRLLR